MSGTWVPPQFWCLILPPQQPWLSAPEQSSEQRSQTSSARAGVASPDTWAGGRPGWPVPASTRRWWPECWRGWGYSLQISLDQSYHLLLSELPENDKYYFVGKRFVTNTVLQLHKQASRQSLDDRISKKGHGAFKYFKKIRNLIFMYFLKIIQKIKKTSMII